MRAWLETSDDLGDFHWESKENSISVLILAMKWQFDTYGLSTVNKSLVNNLRVVDPEGKKIKITCAVVEEEGKIENYEKKDAEKYKVELRGGKQPIGSQKKPNLEWLDQNITAYYPDLFKNNSYDFIIGHIPYLANGPLNFRELHPEVEHKPKIILMIHDLPKTSDKDIDDESFLEWLSEADYIFSIGEHVDREILPYIARLDPKQCPVCKLYIPQLPMDLFKVHSATQKSKFHGAQTVTVMTGDRGDLEISGLDFDLAIGSATAASKQLLHFDGTKISFVVLGQNEEDKEKWKNDFAKILITKESGHQAIRFQSHFPSKL